MSLAASQALFHAVLRGQVSPSDPRVAQVFVGLEQMSAAERVQIYVEMYVGRQVEALEAEFPRVRKLLGHDAFVDLAQAYLRAHPSQHPDIGQLGRNLGAFIRSHPGVRGDLAELADLERARSLAFTAADADACGWDTLVAHGAEGFGIARLTFVPSLRTLHASHDLAGLWRALDADGQPAPRALAEPACFVIWRQGFEVFHAQLAAAEAQALELARAGEPLERVCEAFAAAEDPASAALEAIASWFNEGWVAGVEVHPG